MISIKIQSPNKENEEYFTKLFEEVGFYDNYLLSILPIVCTKLTNKFPTTYSVNTELRDYISGLLKSILPQEKIAEILYNLVNELVEW